MDIDDQLQAEIMVATQEAFELADALTVEVVVGRLGSRALQLARDYQEKRRYIRRLRRAAKVEVGG
jgi:hypothetical protein